MTGTSASQSAPQAARPINLFVSYSHLDREWFAKLQPLLKFKSPTHVAHLWHDQHLQPGVPWLDEIRSALDRMDVFVCLVSSHFVASDFINEVEVEVALRRAAERKCVIVPLLICDM